MKINPSGGYGLYQPYVSSVKSGEVAQVDTKANEMRAKGAAAANTDKITFSGEASAKAEIGRVTSTVSAEVNSLGSAERLAALREQVQAGTYEVSAEDIADAIIGAVQG